MTSILTFAAFNVLALIVFGRIFTLELRRGHRFFATGPRAFLDQCITVVSARVGRFYTYISRYVITLSWYYSLHALLKVILKFLAGTYTAVEALFHHNRKRARKIRIERKREQSHLSLIAEHKVETALTPDQKVKLKEKALRGE
jgi:hypothetical protein